jgi:riboflavin kinase / FMN adenylyltransferase
VTQRLVLLVIDTDRLTSPVREDDVPDSEQTFPHVYGPINPDAVVETWDLSLPPTGSALSRLTPVPIWRSLDKVPTDLGRTAVVIGNFDGVHLGHQHVVARAREIADADGLTLVVVTFDPHPMAVLRPEHAPSPLTSVETRARLLGEAGADAVFALPFDREIAGWSPEEFIDRILVEALHASAVVVGANFRFGHRAAGDVATLREAGEYKGFVAEGIALDGGPQVWSSTYVRTCLATGDVAGAAEALGRPFTVRGVVVEGDKRGRELGFPTANVPASGTLATPADGVYAGWLRRLDTGERFPAAISVGTNPTFDGRRESRVESYVLDRTDLELYGVEVEVGFVDRLRGMVAFDSVDKLVAQMHDDVEEARRVLAADEEPS